VFSKPGSWLNPTANNIAQSLPGSLFTQPNGEDAIDGFNRNNYLEDIKKIKALGVGTYRLSISWPRLFPHIGMNTPDEQEIEYYTNVLNAVKAAGLTPLVTLYHWDLLAWLYNFGDPKIKKKSDRTYGWLDMRDAKNNRTLKEF
jgi:beta-glucosidase/6-phospho-beta-glucosidase/beta-galactosidase